MDFNQNKDKQGGGHSVFAGILPQEAPAQPAAQVPQEVRRGPSADEAISAVKTKIDAMEKTILAQIERKMEEKAAQAAVQPPPPPPSPVPALMLKKIEDLENRLKDYQERSVVSAGQLKSIEESKIGARREIEDLLKAVREQQKFSELDRQMHEQLQKSWTRVEDLEKKLMDIFTTTSKPAAQEVVQPDPAAVAKVVADAVSPLAALASSVERRLAVLSAKVEAEISDHAQARRAPDRFEEKFFAFKEEMRETFAAAASGLKEDRAGLLEEVSGLIRTALRDESSLVEKYSGEMLALSRDRQDALAKNVSTQMDALVMRSDEESRRVSALSDALDRRAAQEQERAQTLAAELAKTIAAFGADVSAKIADSQKEQTEKLKAVCGLAGSSLGGLEAARSSVSRLQGRLAELEKAVGDIVKGMDAVNLEGLLGVSGVMVRKNYEALTLALGKFSEEEVFLREAQAKLAAVLKAGGAD